MIAGMTTQRREWTGEVKQAQVLRPVLRVLHGNAGHSNELGHGGVTLTHSPAPRAAGTKLDVCPTSPAATNGTSPPGNEPAALNGRERGNP